MKKIFLTALVIIASHSLFAQSLKFGVKAGVTLPKLESKAGGGSISTESDVNFMFGGYADVKLAGFSLQPGLALVGKGGKSSDSGLEVNIKLMYLEVPVNIIRHFPIGIGSIYLGAGPYAAYGISGKAKASFNGESESEDITFGSNDDDVKSTDFGLNTLGGIQLKSGFNIGANYGFGLSSISNDSDENTKNKVLSFTVGYFF